MSMDTFTEHQRGELSKAAAELRRLTAEVSDLREKLAKKAELLRGCYAADKRQKQRIAKLESAIKNLQKVKGRYHTKQAYNALVAALQEDKTC